MEKRHRRSGRIHIGYGEEAHTFSFSLPFTPSRVEVQFASEGWQVCGGSQPEISEPEIVENGFVIRVRVTSNVGTLYWWAYD